MTTSIGTTVTTRDVSSEYFWKFSAKNFRKFILIFPEICKITYINQLFPSLKLQSDDA